MFKSSELSNEEYHKQRGEGEHFFSSSQLKDILDDPELFHRKYILGEIENESKAAFDIGTYFHTAILEPEKLMEDCAIYEGATRRGKSWDAFKEENAGKAILTLKDLDKAKIIIDAAQASPITMDLLKTGEPEVSFFVMLEGVPVKVRFDWLCLGKKKSYAVDLKSTTGNAKDEDKIRHKIVDFKYDMSAALYVDAVNEFIRLTGMKVAPVTEFYWPFASKDYANCKVYLADSKLLAIGRAKYKKALRLYAKHAANDWQFCDEIANATPFHWEESWLQLKDDEEGPKSKHSNTKSIKTVDDSDLL